MKTAAMIGALLVAGCITCIVRAEESVPASYATCVACHGADGAGNAALNAPALAGQQAAYLERQLQHFKSGVRGADPEDTLGMQMRGMAAALGEEAIAEVAAYLAGLNPPAVKSPASGDLKNGNNYYQSKCGACHGGKAEGNAALNAPALAYLDATYLTLQYKNFQNGLRGTHAEDRFGRQMKMMSNSLPEDADLVDVIAFIQSLGQAQ